MYTQLPHCIIETGLSSSNGGRLDSGIFSYNQSPPQINCFTKKKKREGPVQDLSLSFLYSSLSHLSYSISIVLLFDFLF